MDEKASQSNNKSANAKIVSFANSKGTDGCMVHIHLMDHTTHECHVLKKHVNKIKWSWSDNNEQQEPKKRFKPNSYNNQKSRNQKGNTGDLHALMEQTEKIKESLEKVLKQGNKKRKTQMRRKSRDFFLKMTQSLMKKHWKITTITSFPSSISFPWMRMTSKLIFKNSKT